MLLDRKRTSRVKIYQLPHVPGPISWNSAALPPFSIPHPIIEGLINYTSLSYCILYLTRTFLFSFYFFIYTCSWKSTRAASYSWVPPTTLTFLPLLYERIYPLGLPSRSQITFELFVIEARIFAELRLTEKKNGREQIGFALKQRKNKESFRVGFHTPNTKEMRIFFGYLS